MSFRASPYLSWGSRSTNPPSGAPATTPWLPLKAFIFLIRYERINFAAAHEHNVADLGAAQVFLQENALGIINVPKPRTRVLDRLA